jgi:predicted transposase YdaD
MLKRFSVLSSQTKTIEHPDNTELLGVIFRELRQTRFYQEIWEEGYQEGYEEGRQEILDKLLPWIVALYLKTSLTVEQTAKRLQMDVEMIQRAAQSSGHNEGS